MDFYGQSYEELLAKFDKKKWSLESDLELFKMELEDARSKSSATKVSTRMH